MKNKVTKIRLSTFKFLLFLPLLLLSFCDSNLDEPILNSENSLTKEAKVLSLMKAAIQSNSDQNSTKNKRSLSKSTATEETGQCTNFLYPMTFEVYSGDDPDAILWEINSDQELIAFIDQFTFEDSFNSGDELIASTPNYELYIFYPIILLDTDGVETELRNLTELEGTLQMAVEACANLNDESSGGSENDSNDESDDGNSNDNDESSDGSDNDESNDGSENDSNDESDDGNSNDNDDDSNDESSDGSDNDESDDGNSNDSNDESDDENSNDNDDNDSNDESSDGSDNDSNDESDDGNNNDDDGYKYCDQKKKKVSICHKGKTICISVNAIWGHMQHHKDDYLGSCEE